MAGITAKPESDREQAQEPMPQETVKEMLKCILSLEERDARATILASKMQDLARAKEELDTIKAQYKSRFTGLEAEINETARVLHAGYEMRLVECEVERDYDEKVIRIYRLDTGALVRSRAMTLDECQRALEFHDGSPSVQ